MAYNTALKQWGDDGQEYPDGYFAEEDHPPIDDFENFFRYHAIEDLQHLIQTTENLNSQVTDLQKTTSKRDFVIEKRANR